MNRPRHQREVVFCHHCSNEWYRDEHGLQCPTCEGHFTEVIEADSDPRSQQASTAPHPFHNHNPWANAPDPDEDDIDQIHNHPRQPGFGGGPQQQPNQQSPIFQMIGNVINSLAPPGQPGPGQPSRGQPIPGQYPGRDEQVHTRRRSMQEYRQTSGPMPGQPHVHVWTNSGPGYSFTARTSTTQFGRNDRQGQPMPMMDIQALMNTMFQNASASAPSQNHSGATNFQNIINGMLQLNGQNAGDYMHSDEALDALLSQMRDSQTNTTAPGPATRNAIASLTRRPAVANDLKTDTATEPAACPICVEVVKIGEELLVLPCNHWFHPVCIEAWLGAHDSCPVCRKGIVPKEGDSSTARRPEQEPLNDMDPVEVGRRQGSTAVNPIVIPESPAAARRGGGIGGGGGGERGQGPPRMRRHSSSLSRQSTRDASGGGGSSGRSGGGGNHDSGGGAGLGDRFRGWFNGGSSSGSGGRGGR